MEFATSNRMLPCLPATCVRRVEKLSAGVGVAQIFNLLYRRFAIGRLGEEFPRPLREGRHAEHNSAIRQIEKLRHDFAMAGSASSSGGTAPPTATTNRVHNPASLFCLALLALVVCAFLPIVD